MARKTDKKKPSRNVLVVPEKKTKGRGKNKTTEVKAKRGKLGTRLFCVPLTPKTKGADRKKAKYSCFGSFEEASVALLAAAPLPATSNPALAEMLKMQATAGMRGRRRGLRSAEPWADYMFDNARRQIAEAKRLGFDTSSMEQRLAEQEGMRTVRSMDAGLAPGSSASWDQVFAASDAADEAFRHRRGLRGALPARGLRGTPEEHLQRRGAFRNAYAMVSRVLNTSGDDMTDRERLRLRDLVTQLRTVASENGNWADPDQSASMVDPREPWGYVHGDREVATLERYGGPDLQEALNRARGDYF
jgi:hypothetical protein